MKFWKLYRISLIDRPKFPKDSQIFLSKNSLPEIFNVRLLAISYKQLKQLKPGVITENFQVYMTKVNYINFYFLRDGEWSAATKSKLNILEDLTLEKSYHSVDSLFCLIRKLGAVRSQFRRHRKCSITILCMRMESWIPGVGS